MQVEVRRGCVSSIYRTMPRASLPARTSTPKHRTPGVKTFHSLRKRKSTPPEPIAEIAEPAQDVIKEDEVNPEADLEAWQEFAADNYEMVEQLPLELHRNYRLLRELDDGCTAQTAKLHVLIREYISLRIPPSPTPIVDSASHIEHTDEPEATTPPPKPSTTLNPEDTLNPQPEVQNAEALGVPIPDGQGGLILPNLAKVVAEEAPDTAEPLAKSMAHQATPTDHKHLDQDETLPGRAVSAPQALAPSIADKGRKASVVMAEISRLAREIVRNGEEKVAVAAGAYNSVSPPANPLVPA
jgi:hypothetical protein